MFLRTSPFISNVKILVKNLKFFAMKMWFKIINPRLHKIPPRSNAHGGVQTKGLDLGYHLVYVRCAYFCVLLNKLEKSLFLWSNSLLKLIDSSKRLIYFKAMTQIKAAYIGYHISDLILYKHYFRIQKNWQNVIVY